MLLPLLMNLDMLTDSPAATGAGLLSFDLDVDLDTDLDFALDRAEQH